MHPVEWMRETAAIMDALSDEDDSTGFAYGGGRVLMPVMDALVYLETDPVKDRGFVVFLLRDSGFSFEEVMESIDEVMAEWQIMRRSLLQGTKYLQ